MKKRERSTFLPIAACGLLAVVFIAVSVWFCEIAVGRAVNIIAVLIMISVIFWGYGIFSVKNPIGLIALSDAEEDLHNAREKINEHSEDPETDLRAVFSFSPLFEQPDLVEAYDDYQKESDRLDQTQRDYFYCDIADYINKELLDQIANRAFNDLVGGTMTGMGILGTFIGLSIGLHGFNSSSSEEMLLTISNLIDGIKVAFLTSIFGMIFSIIFHFLYHQRLAHAENELEQFLQLYYEKVAPRPDNEGITQMLQYEAQQTRSMEQFAEDISLALSRHISDAFMPVLSQIDQSMKMQAEQLPQAVAAAIGESVVPTLTGIETNIGQLTDQITETQNQNIGRIAEEFVAHMDQAMGSQLEHLGESIQTLCEWQESAAENMKGIADQVCETGERLGTVNEDLRSSASAFSGYLQQLEVAQSYMTERFDHVLKGFEELSVHTDRQKEAMEQLLSSEKQSLEHMKHLNELTAQKLDELKDVFGTYQQQIQAVHQAQLSAITCAQENMENHLKTQQEQLADALREQEKQTSAAIAEQREAVAAAQKALDEHLTMQQEQLANALQGQEKQASAAIAEQREATAEAQKALDENLKTQQEQLVNALQEQEKQTSAAIAEQREAAAAAQKALDENLKTQQERLANALQEQEKQASAAIAEQREAVAAAQKAMSMQLKAQQAQLETALQQQTQRISNSLNTQAENLQKSIGRIDELQKSVALSIDRASESMERSAAAMTSASSDLTQNLNGAMERTFGQIDKQLAEVVKHLSGTISEILDTTEKVPQIIQISNEQMQRQTNRYLQSVSDSQRRLAETVTELTRPNEHSKSNQHGVK